MIFNMKSIYIKPLWSNGGHPRRHFGNYSCWKFNHSHAFSMLYTLYQLLPEYVEKTTIMNFKRFITIYGYGYAMAAILDAILKMIAFPMWDFGGLLVCYLWYQVLSKSVEKPFA